MEEDLNILVLKHLSSVIDESTLSSVSSQLRSAGKLPTTVNWLGQEEQFSDSSLHSTYNHVAPVHLRKLVQTSLAAQLGSSSLLQIATNTSQWQLVANPPNVFHRIASRRYGFSRRMQSDEHPRFQGSLRLLKCTLGHLYPVYCVACDHKGQYMFTGSDDRLVKMWSIRTGRLIRTFRGHVEAINDIIVAPDDTFVVSVSKVVRIWSFQGVPLAVLTGHTAQVMRAQFSSGWNNFVVAQQTRSCIKTIDQLCRFLQIDDSDTHRLQQMQLDINLLTKVPVTKLASVSMAARAKLETYIHKCLIKGLSPEHVFPNFQMPSPPQVKQCDRLMFSCSLDGTCMIWNCNNFDAAPVVVKAQPVGEAHHQSEIEFLCMSVHPTRREFVSGHNDSHVRVFQYTYRVTSPDLEKCSLVPEICKQMVLRGHTNEVEFISYSSSGQCFLSGAQDGTVRIWAYTTSHAKPYCQSVIRASFRGGRPTSRRAQRKHAVVAANWTCDDRFVVVATANKLIQVFDPHTAGFVAALDAHSNEPKVIAPHPVYPSVLATAGEDGRVCLWDLGHTALEPFTPKTSRKGVKPNSSENAEPSKHPVKLVKVFSTTSGLADGQWTPTGHALALSSTEGNVVIVGTGSRDEYYTSPNEQFFTTDYRNVRLDSFHNVVDEETQQPPHLMNAPLCNAQGNTYAQQPMSWTVAPLSEEQIREVKEAASRSTDGVMTFEERLDELQSRRRAQQDALDRVRCMYIRRVREMLQQERLRKRLEQKVPPNLSPDDSSDDDDIELRRAENERLHNAFVSEEWADTTAALEHHPPAEAKVVFREEIEIDNDDDDDDGGGDQDSEFDEPSESDPSEDEHASDDNYDHYDDDISDMGLRRSRRSRRGLNRRPQDYSDVIAESPIRPHRRRTGRLRRPGSQNRRYVDDSDDDEVMEVQDAKDLDTMVSVDDPRVKPFLKNIRAQYGNNSWLQHTEQQQSYQQYTPQCGDRVVYVPGGHARFCQAQQYKTFVSESNCEPPFKQYPALTYPTECVIVDLKYCFPSERQELPVYCKLTLRPVQDSPLNDTEQRRFCSVVSDIERKHNAEQLVPQAGPSMPLPTGWQSPSNTRRAVGVSSSGEPAPAPPRAADPPPLPDSFVLDYFDYDEAVFLVPARLFHDRVSKRMAINDKVQVYYQDSKTWYPGRIAYHSLSMDLQAGYPGSLWETYAVLFDDAAGQIPDSLTLEKRIERAEASSRRHLSNHNLLRKIEMSDVEAMSLLGGKPWPVNPWELYPADDSVPKEGTVETPSTYQPPSHIPDELAAALKTEIAKIMDTPLAKPFSEPVDVALFVNYPSIVPYPVDLSKISDRLQGRYYRSIKSLQHDINMIAVNAALYNEEGAEIITTAQAVTSRVLACVQNILTNYFHSMPTDSMLLEPSWTGPRFKHTDHHPLQPLYAFLHARPPAPVTTPRRQSARYVVHDQSPDSRRIRFSTRRSADISALDLDGSTGFRVQEDPGTGVMRVFVPWPQLPSGFRDTLRRGSANPPDSDTVLTFNRRSRTISTRDTTEPKPQPPSKRFKELEHDDVKQPSSIVISSTDTGTPTRVRIPRSRYSNARPSSVDEEHKTSPARKRARADGDASVPVTDSDEGDEGDNDGDYEDEDEEDEDEEWSDDTDYDPNASDSDGSASDDVAVRLKTRRSQSQSTSRRSTRQGHARRRKRKRVNYSELSAED